MTDKKTFGAFIKARRIERSYSQKDLAELLFVTEGAISKWERGVSYPDITLIADICRVLSISEHEFITASTDTDTRKVKEEARKFRTLRSAWIRIPTISYLTALLICFICNLAVNHTLSWFFVVFSSLLCAFAFIPSAAPFFRKNKLLAFCISNCLSICLLLFTCAVYTNNPSWLSTACIGVLLGYTLCFAPILLANTRISRFRFVITLAAAFLLTLALLLIIHSMVPIRLSPAILMACYGFIPAILCAAICTLRFDSFLRAGICVAIGAVICYFAVYMVDLLFGTNESACPVNFGDWPHHINGNVRILLLVFLGLVSAALTGMGFFRICNNKK